jgi:nitrite reductase/ring-hydroxylating ferredoxin subunit
MHADHAAHDDDAGFEKVCAVRDVPPGALKGVTLSDGSRVCIGNRAGTVFAVSDRCPHQKFPLSDGELTPEGTIVCSWHGASFDCTSGRAVRGPLRSRGEREQPFGRVSIFETRVENDHVFVRRPPGEF